MAEKLENLNFIQAARPRKINLDDSENVMKPDEAKYIKNVRSQVAKNGAASLGTSTIEGDNKEVEVPLNSTLAICSPILPAGRNVDILTYESKLTNEIYWGVWNSNNNHGIYRLNQDGTCTKIYQDANLAFQLDPQYHIPAYRCWLEILNRQDANGNPTQVKYFVFIDGFNRQRFIDVDTSIATNSFNTTSFPYYQPSYPFCDTNEYIELPTRPPFNAPVVTNNPHNVQALTLNIGQSTNNFNIGEGVTGSSSGAKGTIVNVNSNTNVIYVLILNNITFTIADTVTDTTTGATCTLSNVSLNDQYSGLPNLIANQTYQFRTAFYLTDGRQTAWSTISTLSFVSLSPCEDNSESLPRSFNLLCNAGSPLVEKVLIAYRNCNGDAGASTNPTDWYLYASVPKYKPATIGQPFYTRTVGLPNYNAPLAACSPDSANAGDGLANTFLFYFDNSQESVPISITDTNRLYDDLPFTNFGLTPAGDNIITANGLFGWNNLSTTETNKFQIGLGAQAIVCKTKMVTIIIDAVVHNNFTSYADFSSNPPQNTYISAPNNGSGLPQIFGGWSGGNDLLLNIDLFQQTLNNGLGGFIGYLAGTNYSCVSQQYQILSPGNIDSATYVGVQGQGSPVTNYNGIKAGLYYIQRFTFNVPAGNYVFRIASHLSELTDNFQITSTYTSCLVSKSSYQPIGGVYDATIGASKEIGINACNASSPITFPYFLVIQDLASSTDFSAPDPVPNITAQAICGYIQEDSIEQVPIELAYVDISTSGIVLSPQQYGSQQTDHNGFFFASGTNSGDTQVLVFVEDGTGSGTGGINCDVRGTGAPSNNSAGLLQQNIYLPTSVSNIFYTWYSQWAHSIISGTVMDCDGNAVQGVVVVLTHSQFAITDANGKFVIEAHNDVSELPGQGRSNIGRINIGDNLIVSQNGVCVIVTCPGSDCNPCINPLSINYNNVICWNQTSNHSQDMTTENFSVSLVGDNLRGLKNGGTYGWGITVGDDCGRVGNINFVDYLNIPVSMVNCNFSPYTINLKLTSKLAFTDPLIKTVRLSRTRNLNYSGNPAVTGSYLQWVLGGTGTCPSPSCDPAFQFINAQGSPTNANTATYIQIFIDGLYNYNKINNYATNDAFTWADGARIRFLVNGDGNCFNVNTNSLVNTLTDGMGIIDLPLRGTLPMVNGAVNPNATGYFVIDYDTRLENLIGGAMVELYYPQQSQETEVYYEVSTITLQDGSTHSLTFIYLQDNDPTHSGLWINGQPILLNTAYTINTFDTYWLRRAIPQNSYVTPANPVAQPILFTPAYMFEHYAPSDFCCAYCEDIGRQNVIDIYAAREWRPLQAQASNAVVNNGVINGISTFYTINQTDLNINQDVYGDITGLSSDGNILFIICELNWTTVSINDNYLRLSASGNVEANTSYLGRPPDRVGSIYGLQYNYPQAMIFYEGIVCWADVSRGSLVECNYSKAESISDLKKAKSYFNQKLKAIDTLNEAGQFVFLVFGIDPKNKEILITSNYNNDVFINNDRQIVIANNDTFVYNYEEGEFVRFTGYTPESYTQFTGSLNNLQLISFVNGIPYAHNDDSVITWNNFYGTQCEKVIEVIFNTKVDVIKKFLTIEEYCLQCAWYADRVITAKGQLSKIPLISLEQRDTVWYSEIYADINTPNFVASSSSNPLFDGDPLFGAWIRMRFIGDNNFDAKYSELFDFILKGITDERTVK